MQHGLVVDVFENVAQFGSGAAEKLSPGGQSLEKAAHCDVGAGVGGGLSHIAQTSEIEINLGGDFAGCIAGDQSQVANAGDAGQCFAAEAQGADADDVSHGPDLAGGMSFKGQQGVVGAHAAAVVADLDQVLAAILNSHRDLCGSGINGVFHQFFHHRGRPFDNFARGDLVAYVISQNMDSFHFQYLKIEPLVNSRMIELYGTRASGMSLTLESKARRR